LKKQLTPLGIKNLKPSKERREIPDAACPGLYLIVQTSGYKSFAMRFRRPNGKPAKLVLGPVDLSGKETEAAPVIGAPLTLSAARRLAADIHHQRKRGRDPVADNDAAKRRQRAEHEARSKTNFAASARDFIEQHAKKKTRNWKETARILGFKPTAGDELETISKGLAERWGDKPVANIDGHDVHSLIVEVKRLGVPGAERRTDGPSEARARTTFATLSKFFNWLVENRVIEKNPCIGVHKPTAPKARNRVLSDDEIVKFWKATDAEQFGPALRLLLLTGSRLNEVCGMRRSELSEDLSTWTLPGERTKNHLEHIVPLPPLAQDLIPDGDGEFVFTTTGDSQVAIGSKIKGRLDKAMKIPDWVFHDLRRTAASGMAKLQIPPHVIEAVLNHISGAKAGVAGTYNRWGYLPEKENALQRWADHIGGLVSGVKAKVVPMKQKAKV
jgi:integrase